MTEEHPQRGHRVVGRKLLAAPGQGLYSTPRRLQGRGAEGHLRGSKRGNGLLTGRFLTLRMLGTAE
jgi:hypothetical protein